MQKIIQKSKISQNGQNIFFAVIYFVFETSIHNKHNKIGKISPLKFRNFDF